MDTNFQQLIDQMAEMTDQMTKAGLDVSKMSRRDFMRVAAGVTGAAVLAACGGGGSGSGNGVTITQWYHQYGEAGTEQAVFRYAKAYTAANVKVSWILGDYGSKLSAALLTPNGPDVFEGQPTLQMVKAGQIVPLDDLYTADVKSQYTDADLAAQTINGKIYGVKIVDDVGVLYYRKSMLNSAGVAPPTTMDEVIAAAKKLTSRNVKGLFIGNDGGIGSMQNIIPWSAGSDFLVNNQIVFDNPRTVASFEKLRELNQTNALLLGSPTDWWDPSAFTQGLAAMQWTGLWAMPAIIKALGNDFGIMPWPAFDAQGKPATFLGGWSEMVNGHGKHINESKAFVKWLWIDNTQDQTDFNLSYGFHVPPRKSINSTATKLQSGPAAQAVQFFNQYAKALSPIWDAAMGTALNDAVSAIVKNGANAASQVHTAAQKCQAELKNLLG